MAKKIGVYLQVNLPKDTNNLESGRYAVHFDVGKPKLILDTNGMIILELNVANLEKIEDVKSKQTTGKESAHSQED